METPAIDIKQKCLIHILAKALLDMLEDNHGQVVHYNNRDFIVRKSGKENPLIIEEVPHERFALQSFICDEFIKIM